MNKKEVIFKVQRKNLTLQFLQLLMYLLYLEIENMKWNREKNKFGGDYYK